MLSILTLLALAAFSLAQPNLWVEHYDASTDRKYYHNVELSQSTWEPPEGAEVKYMDGSDGGNKRQASEVTASAGSHQLVVLSLFLLPILLVMGGLLALYQQASSQGLGDALRNLKVKRDRSAKRKGTKAGSKWRGKFKLSQDGKGGRSANA